MNERKLACRLADVESPAKRNRFGAIDFITYWSLLQAAVLGRDDRHRGRRGRLDGSDRDGCRRRRRSGRRAGGEHCGESGGGGGEQDALQGVVLRLIGVPLTRMQWRGQWFFDEQCRLAC